MSERVSELVTKIDKKKEREVAALNVIMIQTMKKKSKEEILPYKTIAAAAPAVATTTTGTATTIITISTLK